MWKSRLCKTHKFELWGFFFIPKALNPLIIDVLEYGSWDFLNFCYYTYLMVSFCEASKI